MRLGARSLLSRRAVLGGLAALPAAPLLAQAPSAPDVIVVGAGMAGLSCARALMGERIGVTVIEARERVGGRAFTESTTFGVPYDHGCMWLHSANVNPLSEIARKLGFAATSHDGEDLLYVDGQEADVDGYAGLDEAFTYIAEKLDAAGEAGHDKAVAAAAPARNRWERLAAIAVAQLGWGVAYDRLSVIDWYEQTASGVEWLVGDGLGALVATYGKDVPVRLGTPARRIRWGRQGVAVETAAGTLAAKAVVVTVPTAVVASGALAFDPALPDETRDAFQRLPMGLIDRIALQFKPGALEAEAATTVLSQKGEEQVLDFLIKPFGRDLAIAHVGGKLAHDLEAKGQAAAVEVALAHLAAAFGTAVRPAFVKGHFTRWGADPYARGAFAVAEPGFAASRETLLESLDGRVFFAGEAVLPEWATQLAGAHLSGLRVAHDVARRLH